VDFDTELREPPRLKSLVPVEPDDGRALGDEGPGSGEPRPGQADDEDAPAGEIGAAHGRTNCRKSR
jgi:hypothetical protein